MKKQWPRTLKQPLDKLNMDIDQFLPVAGLPVGTYAIYRNCQGDR